MARQKLHPEEIKAKLRIQFPSVKAFEKKHGLPSGSTFDVLRGRKSSRTVAAIAKAINVSEKTVRESYKADRSTVPANSTSDFSDSHSLNEGAK